MANFSLDPKGLKLKENLSIFLEHKHLAMHKIHASSWDAAGSILFPIA
jgi:hypothetical protein